MRSFSCVSQHFSAGGNRVYHCRKGRLYNCAVYTSGPDTQLPYFQKEKHPACLGRCHNRRYWYVSSLHERKPPSILRRRPYLRMRDTVQWAYSVLRSLRKKRKPYSDFLHSIYCNCCSIVDYCIYRRNSEHG